MLVGLGCGDKTSCRCKDHIEEGLAGILGDLGDITTQYSNCTANAFNRYISQGLSVADANSNALSDCAYVQTSAYANSIEAKSMDLQNANTQLTNDFNSALTDGSKTVADIQADTIAAQAAYDTVKSVYASAPATVADSVKQMLTALLPPSVNVDLVPVTITNAPIAQLITTTGNLGIQNTNQPIPISSVTTLTPSQVAQQNTITSGSGTGPIALSMSTTPTTTTDTSIFFWGGLGLLGLVLFMGGD